MFSSYRLIPITISFLLTCLLFYRGNAQDIEWLYEVATDENSRPSFFWVDDEGTGYYNITLENPENPADANYGSILVMLDTNGKFLQTTRINNCDLTVNLYPFWEDTFVSSGFSCMDGQHVKHIRLYNAAGETLSSSDNSFPGHHFASAPTEDGFTFFSKDSWMRDLDSLTMGTIDEVLDIHYSRVSLDKVRKEGFKLADKRDAALLSDGTWIIPMSYGVGEGARLSIQDGFVMGIKDNEVKWSFSGNQNRRIQGITAHKSQAAVLFGSGQRKYSFYLLSSNGQVVKSLELKTEVFDWVFVRDFIVTDNEILILTSDYLFRFDWDGNLLNTFDLQEEGFELGNGLQETSDGSVILTARRNGKAVMMKMNYLGITEPALIVETNPDSFDDEEIDVVEDAFEITYSSIDREIDQSIISASVYPNPASTFIHFQFNREVDFQESFTVQIYSSSGRIVQSQLISQNSEPISVQNLPAGNYIYRVISKEEKQMVTGQFIKIER